MPNKTICIELRSVKKLHIRINKVTKDWKTHHTVRNTSHHQHREMAQELINKVKTETRQDQTNSTPDIKNRSRMREAQAPYISQIILHHKERISHQYISPNKCYNKPKMENE